MYLVLVCVYSCIHQVGVEASVSMSEYHLGILGVPHKSGCDYGLLSLGVDIVSKGLARAEPLPTSFRKRPLRGRRVNTNPTLV